MKLNVAFAVITFQLALLACITNQAFAESAYVTTVQPPPVVVQPPPVVVQPPPVVVQQPPKVVQQPPVVVQQPPVVVPQPPVLVQPAPVVVPSPPVALRTGKALGAITDYLKGTGQYGDLLEAYASTGQGTRQIVKTTKGLYEFIVKKGKVVGMKGMTDEQFALVDSAMRTNLNQGKASYEKYLLLQLGMTREQVVAIIGSEGVVDYVLPANVSGSPAGDEVGISWYASSPNQRTEPPSIMCIFLNNMLAEKNQIGLK